MSLLSSLAQPYSFAAFLKFIYNLLGPTSLVLVGIAFLGLVGYVVSIPRSRSITSLDPKTAGIGLFNYLTFLIFVPGFIWIGIDHHNQVILLLELLIVPFIATATIQFSGVNEWGYLDFVTIKAIPQRSISRMSPSHIPEKEDSSPKKTVPLAYPPLKKKVSGVVPLIALVIEFYIFIFIPLTFSLFIWLYLCCFFVTFTLSASYSFGFLSSMLSADLNRFVKDDGGVIVGFVISRDVDHFHIMTENGTISLFSNRIAEMRHLTTLELVTWRERANDLMEEAKIKGKKGKGNNETK